MPKKKTSPPKAKRSSLPPPASSTPSRKGKAKEQTKAPNTNQKQRQLAKEKGFDRLALSSLATTKERDFEEKFNIESCPVSVLSILNISRRAVPEYAQIMIDKEIKNGVFSVCCIGFLTMCLLSIVH